MASSAVLFFAVAMVPLYSALLHAPVSPAKRLGYTILGDQVIDETMNMAKAGTPVHLNGSIPQPHVEQWRMELGDRIVKAASAKDAMHACGSFYSFGDIVLCKKAMPVETETAKANKVYSGRNYIVNAGIANSIDGAAPKPDEFIALSYGIEGGDLYSEIMSNSYGVKTKLFDCYYNGNAGPAAVPTKNLSSTTPCAHRTCYSTPYEMNRVCVDEKFKERAASHDGRLFEPLTAQLAGRKPLSVFLKMDVEGAEWATLRKLLADEDEMAKLRTINFEIHFNMGGENSKASLEEMVGIMEKLSKKFAVTGSTVELLHRSHLTKFAKGIHTDNGDHLVYSRQGVPLDQYCISFVNRKLL
jgi:hypothetical protein